MRYCVNPNCSNPENPDFTEICQNCNSGLLLSGRFRPIEMVGKGGFGRIFRAIDEHDIDGGKCLIKQFYPEQGNTNNVPINRNVKTIIPGYQTQSDLEEIHKKEIKNLARLKHPQIPIFITHFEQDGYLYLVQEFIEGTNLKNELEIQGAFTEEKIWKVLKELLPVIKYIHSQNIIHRDIKPENIMRSSEKKTLVLVDFGAAKFIAPRPQNITRNIGGTAIGTPDFMAPEQQNGREVFSSDLYSLGVTCICLLTNKDPSQLFDDGSHAWKWKDYCPKVTNKLEFILDKLIELGTSNRYSSSDEVLQDIEKLSPRFKRSKQPKSIYLTNWEKAGIIGTILAGIAGVTTAFSLFSNTQGTAGNTQEINQVLM